MPHLLLLTMCPGRGWWFGEHHLAFWAGGFHLWTEGARGRSRLSTEGAGEAVCPPHFGHLSPACQPLPSPSPQSCLVPWSPPSLPYLGLRPRSGACGNQTDLQMPPEGGSLAGAEVGVRGVLPLNARGPNGPMTLNCLEAGAPGARSWGVIEGGDKSSDRPRGPLAPGSAKAGSLPGPPSQTPAGRDMGFPTSPSQPL